MTGSRRVLEVLGRSAGGIAKHVSQIVAALDGVGGLRIDIAGPPDLPVPMPKAVRPIVIPDGPLVGHRRAVAGLRDLVRRENYDVVHAHGLRAGIDAGLGVRGERAVPIVTVHNLVRSEIAGWRAPLYRRAEAMVVRVNDRTFAVSADIAAALRTRSPRSTDKIEVLHLGIGGPPHLRRTRAEIRTSLGLGAPQPLIATVARIDKQKALDVLLRAVAALPEEVHLVVVGRGPLQDDLERLAQELGIDRRVAFLGWRDDAPDFVAAADVFTLSSVWEGVPLAAQEAILLGVPVVATNAGGMSELVRDGISGRLVPTNDPAALAAALRATLDAPEDASGRAAVARRELEISFSTPTMLDRLEAAYGARDSAS